MTRLAPIATKKLVRLLEKLGFSQVRRKGSHRFFIDPATKHTTVVLDHGSGEIGVGLLRAILRDIEINIEEFERLRHK